jgi:Do/DeqQ family serine protease
MVEAARTANAITPMDLSRVFVNVAKRAKPTVVHINVVQAGARQASPRNGQSNPAQGRRETGSGVIVSPDGYILTNNHVAGNANEIKVKLADGRELTARRIGVDNETDLALIKVEAQNLPYATLGDSSKLEQGEWVIALGSPFGLEQTMTAGIVSATGRTFGGTYDNYIQTDASINPGNSGGPLLNMYGEVVGINTMIYSRSGGSEGVGFSIPSNQARRIKDQLLRNGRVSRGYLGASLKAVSTTNASGNVTTGAMVGELNANGPAAKSGLRTGDVIYEFDGKPVKSPKQLTEIIGDTPASKTVTLKFMRDGRAQSTSIMIGERPGRVATENRTAPGPNGQQRRSASPEIV